MGSFLLRNSPSVAARRLAVHVALPWLFWSLVAVLSLQLGVSLSTEERILVSRRYTTGNECKLQELMHSELVLYLKSSS